MSYQRFKQVKEEPRWEIHPVWRGIGCLFLILIPIMSYAIATLLMAENSEQGWVRIPSDLARTVEVPGLGSFPNLYATLILTLVVSVGLFAVFTVLYSVFYSAVGPPKYGPTDSPPVSYKARRKRKTKR